MLGEECSCVATILVSEGSYSLLKQYAFLVAIFAVVLVGSIFRLGMIQATFSQSTTSKNQSKTNCPICGARTTIDPPHCDYCEESLPDENGDA